MKYILALAMAIGACTTAPQLPPVCGPRTGSFGWQLCGGKALDGDKAHPCAKCVGGSSSPVGACMDSALAGVAYCVDQQTGCDDPRCK